LFDVKIISVFASMADKKDKQTQRINGRQALLNNTL